MSPGAIYIYFKSKEDIIRAIADKQHLRAWDEQVDVTEYAMAIEAIISTLWQA